MAGNDAQAGGGHADADGAAVAATLQAFDGGGRGFIHDGSPGLDESGGNAARREDPGCCGVYERARGILDARDDLREFTRSLQDEPQGRLRLTCSADFALVAANRWIAGFLQRWPRVGVEAEFTSRRIDLVHEAYDLALRVGELDDSRLAARRLGELSYGLYASPAYLARNTAPSDPQALLRFFRATGCCRRWCAPSSTTQRPPAPSDRPWCLR